MTHHTGRHAMWPGSIRSERRVRTSIYLPHLTAADGEWLAKTLPVLQRNARPEPQAVQVEDIALRYRSGRLGIADALDATAELLAPFATAGASIEHRGEWYISDDDEDDDDHNDLFETEQPTRLADMPREDLLVSARFVVDAAATDAGAAALYWAVLGLTSLTA